MHLLQPGYSITKNEHQPISAGSFALGGILRFYFPNSITAGIYGGSQKTSYESANSENSYLSLGYGGAFAGYSKRINKFRYTAAIFTGVGTLKNLHIESQFDQTLAEAYWYRKSCLVYSPILSVDFALSQRLNLSFQTIYLIARPKNGALIQNPTFQVGVLFNR